MYSHRLALAAACACLLALGLTNTALAARPFAAARDKTPPTVAIVAPGAESRVWGTTRVAASASDNVVVSRVEFFVDGVRRHTDSSAPYEFAWDTRSLAAGARPVLTARAYDAAGLTKLSTAVTVNVSRKVPLGSAVSRAHLEGSDARYRSTLLANFSSITPENEMKFGWLQPQRGVFDFTSADALVDFAEANGKQVRGHTLVWDGSNPAWLWQGTWTRAEALALLEDHIKTVVSRYRGRVQAWDVVNEPFNEDGTIKRTLWQYYLGDEYIELAFRWAREADPSAKLVLNDYTVERANPKSDAMLRLVKDFKARGVPIDGVGFQAHAHAGPLATEAELVANMERFGAAGVDVELTELDVAFSAVSLTDKLLGQAELYGRHARACRRVSACKKVTVWGVSDATSWLGLAQAPLLFDGGYAAKPAFATTADELALSSGPR